MYTTTKPRFYSLICVVLILITHQGYGAPSTTDGDYSSGAQWGAATAPTFDFIVVGGGAAGSIVAARLVQNNFTVLLLEAGGTSSRDLGGTDYVASSFYTNPATGQLTRGIPWTRVDVPLYQSSMTGEAVYNEYNWNITNAMSGLGRTLGGSMAHNGMLWSHPTQHNLDLWNVTGWSYAQYIQYLQKAENYTNSGFAPASSLGTNGPIQIRKAGYPHPSDANFYNACRSAGYPDQPNFNNGVNVAGVGPIAFNIGNNGTSIRQTSALTYLRPLLNNPLLTIALHSQVARVLFSTTCSYSAANGQPTAVGVNFIMTVNGQLVKQTAMARKEVILSSGALGSAKLLLLSGIGPRNELNSVGITPVVVNNNVGQNIRNHPSIYIAYNGSGVVIPNEFDQAGQDLAYGTDGTGIYSDAGFATIELRMKTMSNLVDPDITLLPLISTADPLTKGFGILMIATEPEYALGTVTLASSNPLDQLVYTTNLANISNNDVNTLVRGIQNLRVIMSQPAASVFGAETFPSSSVSTVAQLQAFVRQDVTLVYHYAGSAKMGNAGDPLRVVNPFLQVVGTNNLRVIDPSINAGAVYGFMQATAVGIAEKGVSMIINQWS